METSYELDTGYLSVSACSSHVRGGGERHRHFDKITVRELGDVRTLPPGAVGCWFSLGADVKREPIK